MPGEWTEAEIEALSAYIDGQLDARDRTALEARLAENADLRQELAAMRQTVALLRDLPTIRAPRAFTLTPEMVGQTAVPAAAELRVLPATKQARPARRVWWVPAASAAGVVLLAGVFFVVTQQYGSGQMSPSAARQEVAVAATTTSTATLEGSFLNTLAQQAIPQIQIGATSSPDQNQSTGSAGEQSDDVPEDAHAIEEIDGEADAARPDEELPRETTLALPTQVAMTQVDMPAPVAPPVQSETGQGEPRFASSPTALPSATGEILDVMIAPPTQLSTASPDPALFETSGGGPFLPETVGSANPAPFGTPMQPGAVAGMEMLNTNPNAPGFTVATLSPVQGTVIAQYNAPELDLQQPEPATDQEIDTPIDAASSAMQQATEDVRAKTKAPIWIRWLNALSDWVLQLLGQ